MSRSQTDKPIVYSCSGCSSAAQLTNALAIRLDREGKAEMSCIAGVGGGVKSLVKKARTAVEQGRQVIALDGCHLQCARHCLDSQGIKPDLHLVLSEHGVRKRYHQDFEAEDVERVYETLLTRL